MFNSALYRNFTYAAPVSNPITPAQILVIPAVLPMASAPFQGLNFSTLASVVPVWFAPAGQTRVSIIGYNVVPFPPQAEPAPLAADLTLDLGTVEINGISGSVSITQVSTSEGLPAETVTLQVYDTCNEVCSIKQTDSVTVTPLATIQTTLTITLNGGSNGVSLNNFATNETFGVQPE
jgi:hypothetical protein